MTTLARRRVRLIPARADTGKPAIDRLLTDVQSAIVRLEKQTYTIFDEVNDGMVPKSGTEETAVLHADGIWRTVGSTGSSGVASVTAGTNLSGGGTGAVTINVIASPTFAGTVSITPMTTGSVLFAGAAGAISQDNANLFWNDTDNRLGIGTTAAPAYTIDVRNTHASSDIGRFQNNSATGYSTLGFYDTASFGFGFIGYGNVSVPDTTVRGLNYWRTNTANMVVSYGSGTVSTPAIFVTGSNGNVNIGPTASDPSVRLKIEASVTAQPAAIIVNTSTSGYSAIDIYNSSSAFQGGLGFGNSAVALTHLRGLHYWYSGSADHVFANATRNNAKVGMTADSAFVELANGASAAVSASATGRIRYSTGTSTFQASLNTGAYANIVTGTGTTNTLPKFSSGAGSVLANSLITDDATTVTVGGALSVTGNATIGDNGSDAHVINGTVDFNHAVNIDGALVCTTTLQVNGGATIGDNDADGHTIQGFSVFKQAHGATLVFGGGLRIEDTTSFALGVGGGITFRGNSTGTTPTSSGIIKSMKTNAVDGETGFDLVFGVRQNGVTNPVEALRLGTTLAATFAGAVTCNTTLAVLGNCTLGDAAGDAHVINGTVDFNQAVNVDGVLTATSTLTAGAIVVTTNIISPAPAANQNDYAPTGYATASIWRLLPTASINITGILAPAADGTHLWIINTAAGFTVTLTHDDAASTAANRVRLNGSVNRALATNDAAHLIYIGSRWRDFTGL